VDAIPQCRPGDIDRFVDADHAASYLGLVPSTRQSAKHCYHGPITKQGRSHTRWMMVQAAQHVGKHPGPLGHFFRKLAHKKNRNIAVVATARKLVKIAYLMLKENQPYRYAVPRSTETKLARLRVRGGGERRKSGSPKGTKSLAKLAGGSRTIPSLPEVYRREGLPELRLTKSGEMRTIQRTASKAFVDRIGKQQVIPRRGGDPTALPKPPPPTDKERRPNSEVRFGEQREGEESGCAPAEPDWPSRIPKPTASVSSP
jgi:hypothetical protein